VNLLAGQYAVMNLIPLNAIPDSPYRRPSWERAAYMARTLHQRGVLAKLRRSAAQDVEGGCGQLRARTISIQPRAPGGRAGVAGGAGAAPAGVPGAAGA